MVEKRLDAKWFGILTPLEYRTAGQTDAILISYVLVRIQMVGLVYRTLHINRTFEYQTI